jgi:hypothetical protein
MGLKVQISECDINLLKIILEYSIKYNLAKHTKEDFSQLSVTLYIDKTIKDINIKIEKAYRYYTNAFQRQTVTFEWDKINGYTITLKYSIFNWASEIMKF